MAKSDDRKAKAFVHDYLSTTCGVTFTALEPRNDQPTPDFEMIDSGERILVAELKTLEAQEPSEETGWEIKRFDGGYEASRIGHNESVRIIRKVAKAYRQLSKYPHPWATILHNTDPHTDVRDFFEAFSGERVLGQVDGRRIIDIKSWKIALGSTRKTRYEVDLYIWVDQEEDRPRRLGVWWSTPLGEKISRKYFGAAVGEFKFPALRRTPTDATR